MSVVGPGRVKTLILRLSGATDRFCEAALMPLLCSDRVYQSADAQNAHYPFHVVGQNVQGHFGPDVLECLHLEVSGSHPGLYRAEGMLDRLAAFAHLIRVSVEARLHNLKDGFVLPP
jgi:hypothetical protein